ncbi:MAG TPA: TcpE family conjugal transfer membrane protein [Egibacteraceae bacterium]|jgi:hypothetical protein|nr:TcpE family conjugal transfer membrane protein [Egibacteraceae bacterium]
MIPLPTYTSVFRLRRRLYAVYDWELPVPVGLFETGVFVAAAGLFALIARVLGVEFGPGTAWFYVVPPLFIAYLARQPVADAKQPLDWAGSHARYLLEPRTVHRLADARGRSAVAVTAEVWLERAHREQRP